MSEPKLKPLPVGIADWNSIREQNLFYVDKTASLEALVSDKRKIFISRPRRMGKTLLCSMLKELFTNGDKNFEGTAIYGHWPDNKCYPVIHLSFIDIVGKDFEIALKEAIVYAFNAAGFTQAKGLDKEQEFSGFLKNFNTITHGYTLVFLIDEWDFPLSVRLDNESDFNKTLLTLNTFYSWLRTFERIRYLFVTGIVRYSDASLFTGQDIQDISMLPDFADLLGYTQDELVVNYAPYIKRAAKRLNCTEDALLDKLKNYYDGFCFDYDASVKLYCPHSINKFFVPTASAFGNKARQPSFESYWMNSSNATAALRAFLHRYKPTPENILQICSCDSAVNQGDLTTTTNFQDIKKSQILFQSGIITLKEITTETKSCSPDSRDFICRLTNYDVAAKFTAVVTGYMLGIEDNKVKPYLSKVQSALLDDNLDLTCSHLNKLLCNVHYDFMASAQEKHYRTLIALWLRSDEINIQEDFDTSMQQDNKSAINDLPNEDVITVQEEVPNNLGRIDLLVTTKSNIYVIELKRLPQNADSKQAMLHMLDKAEQQILNKCYINNIETKGCLVSSVQIVISDKYRQIAAWRRSNKVVGMQQGLMTMVNVQTK